ncbi:MAG TPA: hypothetical protein PLC85_10800 [Smithellaceae bacterium]|jgi:hypothetical protein|nr:hypothetical protein [Smithellaceae bacterium]
MQDERFTVGQISDLLQEPPARVSYIIGKHRIKPTERIGIIRLFNPQQVELIRQYLYDIQIRGGHF